MQHVLKNISSLLVISSFLLCAFVHAVERQTCSDTLLPTGRYRSEQWGRGVDILGPATTTTIFELTHIQCNSYEGVWEGHNTVFTGIYSPETRVLSASWLVELTGEWGSMEYYWDGVSIYGQWNQFEEDGLGYEILYPVNSTYQIPEPVTCA